MFLVKDNHVIQAFSTNGSNYAFTIRILPRRLWRNHNLLDAHVFDSLSKEFAIDCIAVTNHILWNFIIWESFSDLLSCPLSSRISSDIEVDDFSAVMMEYDKAIQYAKRYCRNGEEVNSGNLVDVVPEEAFPTLGGWLRRFNHIF